MGHIELAGFACFCGHIKCIQAGARVLPHCDYPSDDLARVDADAKLVVRLPFAGLGYSLTSVHHS